MTAWDDTLAALGWDPGWASAFAPFASPGRQPARVVAAHRDAWILATPAGDRDAVIAGRLRHAALGPVDLPAVGDWVVTAGRPGASGADAGGASRDEANGLPDRGGPDVIQGHPAASNRVPAGLGGRPRHRRPGAGRQRGRRVRGGRPRRRLQPPAPRAVSRRGVVGRRDARRRPEQGRCRRGPGCPSGGRRKHRPGHGGRRHLCPHRGRRGRARRPPPRARPHGRRPGLVRRRQVHPGERAPRAPAPANRSGPRATIPVAATRPPTGSCSGCRAARS